MRALGPKIGSTDFLILQAITQTFLEKAWSASSKVAFGVHRRYSSYFEDLLAKKILWSIHCCVSSSREVWFCWFLHQRILMLWGEAGQGESPIRLNHLPHRQLWIQVRELHHLWGKQSGRESALIQGLVSNSSNSSCSDYSRAQPAVSGIQESENQ